MQKLFRFPLKQHIGAPASAVVKESYEVMRGELIAEKSPDTLGCNIHSSVNGTVATVTEEYIDIEINESMRLDKEYVKIEGNSILELIEAAGLVGLGGAGFPTAVKLNIQLRAKGVVIVNAVECEPILSHNIYRIENKPEEIYKGLLYAMEASGAGKGVIAIKEKNKKAIRAIEKIIDSEIVSIKELPDMYPMGDEKAVVREVLGEILPAESLPSEAGAVIINAETAARITEAIEEKKPFIDKDVTVGGRLIENETKIYMDVPIGTQVSELLEKSGGVMYDAGEIIMGGPFTGKSTSLEEPIVKTTGGLIATMPFLKEEKKMGLLVCACGANEERLKELVSNMGAHAVGVEYCKQAINVNGSYKCSNPGKCPGQAEKIFKLRKAGAQALLISNCTDCSNTVMSIAPSLHMAVHHCTDGALRGAGLNIVRKNRL